VGRLLACLVVDFAWGLEEDIASWYSGLSKQGWFDSEYFERKRCLAFGEPGSKT